MDQTEKKRLLQQLEQLVESSIRLAEACESLRTAAITQERRASFVIDQIFKECQEQK